MKTISRLLLSGAAVCAVALPAGAADYNPPVYVDEAPEWVPVEIGSGWYLRGDISYDFNEPVYDFSLFGEETEHRRISGSVGMGYHFSDWLRADLNLGHIGGDRYTYDTDPDFAAASHTVWTGLANAYVDLGTFVGITPYVGAGAGLIRSKHEVEIDAPTLGIDDFDYSDRQYEFAYTLNAGASYRITDNASVDLGYQFLHSPKMEYLDTSSQTVEEGAKYHQFRVGLRYDLW